MNPTAKKPTTKTPKTQTTPTKDSKGSEAKVPDANGYQVLLDAKAPKISPKTTGQINYQIGISDSDQTLAIRMVSNDGGGLHTKEWISLIVLTDLLDGQEGNTFKSTILKSVMKGASANNAGFLAAVLRSEKLRLIVPSDKSLYLHQLPADYKERKAQLLSMKPKQ
ncbi:hypothetical protein [Vibrio scophthalmi]|uniref:Uncharacterized protein n=1 Tax=Vibrio scophthalmi TaxID=45658 RepID=A0A1E3WRK4_9VIBR|nr:hypothetical protein [Vibrio scophthalmi]ODS12404.1 hypothetical protein VSF3289_02708 [Vibrio scophthalmi]